MRTIQIVNVRWFNATAWYGLYLAKLLQNSGNETLVVTLPNTANWQKAKDFGFDPIFLPFNSKNPLTAPQAYSSLRRLVKQFKPDIINCHRGEGFVWCALLRQQLKNFALVRTRGDQRLPKSNLPNLFLHKHALDAVIATNSRMANHFKQKMGIAPHLVHTILGGVDSKRFCFNAEARAKVRAEFGFTESSYVIGLLGRYDDVKGQLDLIRATALLRAQLANLAHAPGPSAALLPSGASGSPASSASSASSGILAYPDIRLLFIGHPTPHFPQSRLEACAQQEGIAEFVHFTGQRDDVPACISALDAGVVASLWSEAIARAALEIMACGRPLISTTVGVMPDLLPAEAMYEPGDWQALAAKLAMLIKQEDFAQRLLLDTSTRMPGLTKQSFLNSTLQVYNTALANLNA